jgi:hypothetical protein
MFSNREPPHRNLVRVSGGTLENHGTPPISFRDNARAFAYPACVTARRMKLPPASLARLAAAFASLGTGAAFGELPAAPIRESEQAQARIQQETRLLAGTLDAMLGEYGRNNLAGDDAEAVRRLRGSLGSLSATEMRQVVDLLQQARTATDPDAAVKTVANAFTAQKQIVVAIRRILAGHLRDQEAADISRQLHELADRQARNLQNGIQLARMPAGVPPENAGALQQAQLEAQRGEQSAIAEEVKMVRGKIERLAGNPENAAAADIFKSAAKQIERVEPVVETAAESLKAGLLFRAAADEKASRDELRKIARQIAPREQGPEALRKAEQELSEVIAEQKQLRDSTAQQRKQEDFDKWLEEKIAAKDQNDALPQRFRNQPASVLRNNPEIRSRFEGEQHAKDGELAKLEDQQGELAGKTDALAQKISEVPRAAAAMKGATAKMQEARAAMQEANAPQAVQQEDAALVQLTAAHEDLKRRADEAEALASKSGDKAKDLEQLAKVAENLAREEAAVAKEQKPDAAAQQDIARRAAQLAQRVAADAPKAAQPAQAAADDARKGEQAMRTEKPAEGRAAAEQAAKNFAEAAQQIAQEAATAQNAPGQPNNPANAEQMAAAMNQLAQAQQQVAQAQANLQQAAQQAGQASPSAAQAAKSAQQAQASMQQAAQQLSQASQSAGQAAAKSGAQAPSSAQQAMQQAGQQLSAATAQAQAGQNSAAQQSAQSAALSLAQAQASMAAQQAGLSPSQSGAPMPGAQGQGKGQKGQAAQAGQGQGAGKNSQAGNQPSPGAETYTPGDPKAVERGAREAALKKADFIGLPARERAAIEQSLREKYPQEYGALVEQYLLNLANESAKK